MEKIRVLIVDDSPYMRKVIADILSADEQIEVIGEVSDGLEVLEKIDQTHPDVVTLDVVMPNLDGLAALKMIMQKSNPPAVVMVSSYTSEGATLTLDCLRAGAVDFVLKPSGSIFMIGQELIKKVKVAAIVDTNKLKKLPQAASIKKEKKAGVIVIGSSTGGPVALEHILPQIPVNFSVPVLVAQHLPDKFVQSLTEALAGSCNLPVKKGQQGERVLPGVIYFAPGGVDMEVIKTEQNEVEIVIRENNDILTPSVDKLMESVAHVYKKDTVGIILTGMGSDGLAGMQSIKEAGGQTIVQDEKSSVVFGMGKEVIAHGFADKIVPLDQIIETAVEEITQETAN